MLQVLKMVHARTVFHIQTACVEIQCPYASLPKNSLPHSIHLLHIQNWGGKKEDPLPVGIPGQNLTLKFEKRCTRFYQSTRFYIFL